MFVKAKQQYKCFLCGRTIKPNDRYRRINKNFEGIFHYCEKCGTEHSDAYLHEISVGEIELQPEDWMSDDDWSV